MASRLPVGTWILCFIVVFVVAGSAQAVDRLVPQEYPTIQEGINAAQTGDIVLVSPGVYNELIDFLGKTITVRSTDGPAVTILDGGGSGPIVTFQNLEGPGSVLEGFTITNGVATEGAGITILDAYPTILNNTISSNTATTGPGGGILMKNYTPNIDVTMISRIAGNIISENVSMLRGGGLYVLCGYEFPKLENNQWLGNMIQTPVNFPLVGGSTIFATASQPTNESLHIKNEIINVPEWTGVGDSPSSIFSSRASLLIEDSQIQVHNSNAWGGGLETPYAYSPGPSAISSIEINSTTFSTFGDPVSNTDETFLANIRNTENVLLNNVTLSNTSLPNARFRTYQYNDSSTEQLLLQSDSLISQGVDTYFGITYSDKSKFKIENTQFSSASLLITAYGNLNNDITVEGLLINGTNSDNYSTLLNVYAGGYYPNIDSAVSISNVTVTDLTIEDASSEVLRVRAWNNRNASIDIKDIKIEDIESQPDFSNTLLNVQVSNYYYQDLTAEISLDNILLVNPTSTSRPMVIGAGTYYGGGYSDTYTLDANIDIRNTTIAGDIENESSIVIQQELDPEHTIAVNISDSIVEGPFPISAEPASTDILGATVSFQSSMTTVPVEGIGNQIGLATFVPGPKGAHYLSQIAAGDSLDSLGIDSADPQTNVSKNEGTRVDGGLDTGTGDIGYRYSTKSITSDYELLVSNPVMRYESQTGLIDDSTVTLSLIHLGESGPVSEFRGISIRILQEAEHLQLQSATVSDELVNILGQSPEYFEATACGDIITLGMIPSLSDNQLGFTLDTPLDIFELNFGAGTALIGQQSVIETQLIPSDGPGCGTLDVQCLLTDANGETTLLSYQPARITLVPYGLFRRIDANSDGLSNIGDAIFILGFLFNFATPPSCDDAADVNDDGSIDIGDGVYLLASLFTNGAPPPLPGLICGPDTTADDLRCQNPEPCSESVQIQNLTATDIWEITWNESGPVDHVQLLIDNQILARLPSGLGAYILSADEGSSGSVCIRIIGQDSVATDCVELP